MAKLTPLAISVLALLNERPMHPYEMFQLLLERHETRIVKVRPGSLYHTVERLAGQQLVRATGTTRKGNRPERTTYEITDTGSRALTERIGEMLETPVNEYPEFPLALSEAHNLPADEALSKLELRVARLMAEISELDVLIAYAEGEDLPEVYWFAADYLRAVRRTEADWIRRIITRLENEELPWPSNDKT